MLLAFAGGCFNEEPAETSEASQDSFVLLGNIFQNGTLVSFDDITNISGIDMTRIVGLTACDPKALYAVEKFVGAFGITSFKLWFSNTSGQSWTAQATAGKSAEIACDHAQLATLDGAKQLGCAPGDPCWPPAAHTRFAEIARPHPDQTRHIRAATASWASNVAVARLPGDLRARCNPPAPRRGASGRRSCSSLLLLRERIRCPSRSARRTRRRSPR